MIERERATLAVVIPAQAGIQYSETSVIDPKRLGVLDTPHARGMTDVGGAALLPTYHLQR